MCSELVEKYRKYCLAVNFETLFDIKAESPTQGFPSLMAIGAGQSQGDFPSAYYPIDSTPSRTTSVCQLCPMWYDIVHLLL